VIKIHNLHDIILPYSAIVLLKNFKQLCMQQKSRKKKTALFL